ncbi:hypothetical protein AU074_18410 [Pseudomonas sp. ATCC PTA-122608]|uniref:hypothetical protein n=1 Tax=Pseudomonas sp. ATCC PTA-122608 TaxID=1771311 RepID=UPI00096BCACE|nr:hypothetical protein [Pseudomonas sp. ATCC PTA-122608]OLY76466.1 hypothetical protein AU074_18410 [Pseudomonas sp. ATCC PTA-122608]
MNFSTLPLEFLDDLSSSILKSTNPEFVREKLSLILDHYQVLNYEFNYDSAFWRARKCIDENGFYNISELGSPPKELTRAGRLNEINDPILYTSINQYSTLDEISAEEGDYIHIVAYKQIPDHAFCCGTIGEITHINRWGSGLTSETVGKLLNEFMSNMPHEFGKSFVFTDAFLSSLLKDKNAKDTNYMHSRILANLVFSRNPQLDAIAYSGVALESSRNYAIKPNSANRLLQVEASLVLKITKKYKYGMYDFQILKNAEGVEFDGRFIW